jgi:predicted nucleic acid-binding protein
MILVDTNVHLRLLQGGHPHQKPALDAMELLTTREHEHFVVAPQSLYEMYVVCTRPVAQNGLGLTPERAHQEIVQVRTLFGLLPETSNVYATWEMLVAKYGVAGKPAHDARLVALMLEHRVDRIMTFNDADMNRYAEITAINPFEVLGLPRQ